MPQSILKNGAIHIDGVIIPSEWENYYWDDEVANTPNQLMLALAQIEGDVDVYINSAGGAPEPAEAMRMMLVQHAGSVTVKIIGQASSAASLLAMGGDRIEMSAGSFMMIHDPSNAVYGNEQDQRDNADMLAVISNNYASVYANRSGMTQQQARDLMIAETWLGPEAAIEKGLCDALMSESASKPKAEVTMDAARKRSASAVTMINVGFEKSRSPILNNDGGQSGSKNKEMKMPKHINKPDASTPAAPTNEIPATMTVDEGASLQADRERTSGILSMSRQHVASGSIDDEFVTSMITSGATVEMAAKKILDKLSSAQPDINMNANGRGNRVGRDLSRDGVVAGLSLAMTAKLQGENPTDPVATQYAGLSFTEMAAVSMGQALPNHGSFRSRENIMMQAMHVTADFPHILEASVNSVFEQQTQETERTFLEVSREKRFNDFKPHDVNSLGGFPQLQPVKEGGEIKFGTIDGEKETLLLGTYAAGLNISRQALVNDDMGAIQEALDSATMAIPEFEETTFWKMYLEMVLRDKKYVFHSSRKNMMTAGPISAEALSEGRKLMRTFKAGNNVVRGNAPSILLCGPLQQTAAEQIVASIVAAKSGDVNPWSGKLKVVVTEEIEDYRWDLLVDPKKRTCNFRHGWLDGVKAPRVRTKELFGTEGMSMTLAHDFGCGAVNYRGGASNAGAASAPASE